MRLKKLEDGVEFVPETEFETECLRKLGQYRHLTAMYADTWDEKFPLVVTKRVEPRE